MANLCSTALLKNLVGDKAVNIYSVDSILKHAIYVTTYLVAYLHSNFIIIL